MRAATIGILAAALLMTTGCGIGPAKEGGAWCHGIGVHHRCVQFPYDAAVTTAVAALPVQSRFRPATGVRCYAKGSLAVCSGNLRHGHLGFDDVRFRVHANGSVEPICRSRAGGYRSSVFCTA